MGVQMIANDEGECWYSVVKEVQKGTDYNYVLFMDHDNVVLEVADIGMIYTYFPDNLAVALVESVPETLKSELGQWILMKNGKYKANAAYHDANLMLSKDEGIEDATLMITHLQDLIDIGESTPETQSKLIEWKKYRVALNQLNEKSKISDFPKRPQ